jgi:PAS domain-containing protein
MYFREARTPTEREVRLIDYARRVAGIAIERSRSEMALQQAFEEIRKSEGQLRQITDAIPQTIVVLGPDGSVVYVNRTVLDYTGLSSEEVMETDFRERVFHPEDLKRLRETRRNGFSRGVLGRMKCGCAGKTASTVGF